MKNNIYRMNMNMINLKYHVNIFIIIAQQHKKDLILFYLYNLLFLVVFHKETNFKN